jgi:hypothetical protein
MTEYEALQQTDLVDGRGAPIPFSITWVTCDRNRKTGGKVKHLAAAVRCGASHSLIRNKQIAVKPADGSGHPTPVHISLITRVNGQPVMR